MRKYITIVLGLALGLGLAGCDFPTRPQNIPKEEVLRPAARSIIETRLWGANTDRASIHWEVKNAFTRKIDGEDWTGVDVKLYCVLPSLGRDCPWSEASKEVNSGYYYNRNQHSVRVFESEFSFIRRGNRYDLKYSGRPAKPLTSEWQFRNPPEHNRFSGNLSKVIRTYCERNNIENRFPFATGEVKDIRLSEDDDRKVDFPYIGTYELDGRKITLLWSAGAEDWYGYYVPNTPNSVVILGVN